MTTYEKDVKIILNRAGCLSCGDILTSRYRHNFVTCSCGNLSVDGGLDYCKRLFSKIGEYEDLSVYSDAPFEKIRLSLERGSFGKKGNEPLHWVILREMSDDHLLAVIDYCEANNDSKYYEFYLKEKEYRKI